MLRSLALVALAVLGGTVVAGVVFRDDIAQATGLAQSVGRSEAGPGKGQAFGHFGISGYLVDG